MCHKWNLVACLHCHFRRHSSASIPNAQMDLQPSDSEEPAKPGPIDFDLWISLQEIMEIVQLALATERRHFCQRIAEWFGTRENQVRSVPNHPCHEIIHVTKGTEKSLSLQRGTSCVSSFACK